MRILTSIVLLVAFSFSALAGVSPKEKQALVDLYTATNGAEWNTTWNLDADVTTWKGVTVFRDKVIALNLVNNNLTGQLPESVGDLQNLKVLNLHKNNITGNIPATLATINGLKSSFRLREEIRI